MADKKNGGDLVALPPTFRQKSPGMVNVMQTLADIMGQPGPRGARKGVCASCAKPVGAFKDALSVKEYRISGLCQKCQDSVFG